MAPKTVSAVSQTVQAVPTLAKGDSNPQFTLVHDFLRRFGYLPPTAESGPQLDERVSAALERYQKMHGLPVTGAFDEATRTMMAKPRCGMPDLFGGLKFNTTCAWPNQQLTFAFEDGTNQIAGAQEFQAVRQAFQTWANATSFTFTEVERNAGPDVLIDWRPANDPDQSMVGSILAHADFPVGCGQINDSLPRPVHFDDSEETWVVGVGGFNTFDVETVALHEIGHILGMLHSNPLEGSVMFSIIEDNATHRVLTRDDIAGIQKLYMPPAVLLNGTYRIRQRSTNRFLDAHEINELDFRLVTRPAQDNFTQQWQLRKVGTVFVIRQRSNGRFLDAHASSDDDFRVVTRTAGTVANQRWVVIPDATGAATIRQLSTRRFLDAHEIADLDFRCVTRPAQNNDTQRWLLSPAGANTFTIRQRSNGRFMDAHEIASQDFNVVTRPDQTNLTQRWIMSPVGGVYTMVQRSNQRFVDAHEHSGEDFNVVTRANQNNDTQKWVVLPSANGTFTIQQLSGGRFVDAHESSDNDFRVVTRGAEGNDSQRWEFTPV